MSLGEVHPQADLLAVNDLKPWWETAQGFVVTAVAGLSLFLVFKSDNDALRCLPLNGNVTDSFSEPQMMFVNEKCTEEADFFLLNFWWISMLVSCVMFVAINFWEYIPQVTNEVSRFRKLFNVVSEFDSSTDMLIRLVTTADAPDSADYERHLRTASRHITKTFFDSPETEDRWPAEYKKMLDQVHNDAVRYFDAFPYLDLLTKYSFASPICYGMNIEIKEEIIKESLVVEPTDERLQMLDFCEEDTSPTLETLMTQVCRHESQVESSVQRMIRLPTDTILRRIFADSSTWCSEKLIDKSNDDLRTLDDRIETLAQLLTLRQIESTRKLKESLLDRFGFNNFQVLLSIQSDALALLQILRNQKEREMLNKTRRLFLESKLWEAEDWRENVEIKAYVETRRTATKEKCDFFNPFAQTGDQFINFENCGEKHRAMVSKLMLDLDNPSTLYRLESVREMKPQDQLRKLSENGKDGITVTKKSFIDNIRIVDAYKQLLALRQILTVSELAEKLQKLYVKKTNNLPNKAKPKNHFNIRNAYFVRNSASLLVASGAILLYIFGVILGNTDPVFVCQSKYQCIYFSFRTPWVIACAQVAFLSMLCLLFVALMWRFRPHMNDSQSGTDFLLWLCENSGKNKEVENFTTLQKAVEENTHAILQGLRKNLISAAKFGDVGFFLFYLEITNDNIDDFLNSNFAQKNKDSDVSKTISRLRRLRSGTGKAPKLTYLSPNEQTAAYFAFGSLPGGFSNNGLIRNGSRA